MTEYLKKEEFESFLKQIHGKEGFLEKCRRFHNKEKRDIIYVLSHNLLNRGRLHNLAAVDIILMIWNMAWYIKLPKGDKEYLDHNILELIKYYEKNIDKIKSKDISSLDVDDKKCIEDIFERSKQILRPVGAAKFLHIMNPHIFPIWDRKIANHYHKYLHGKRHTGLTKECYFQFCLDCKKILSKFSEEELWNEHKKIDVISDVLKEFPNFRESILKMLDECNYMGITEELRDKK